MKLGDATVQAGTISSDVTSVQKYLVGMGYNVAIDGNFGPQTQAAVIAFQKARGLMPDGIVGPQTWAALKGETPPPLPIVIPPPPVLRQAPPLPSPFNVNPLWIVAGVGAVMLLGGGKKTRR